MSDIAIQIEGLGKQYRIGAAQRGQHTHYGYQTLREALTDAAALPFRAVKTLFHPNGGSGRRADSLIWALKDASLEIKRGEVVGVIGRNGAGKSTLLKILSRITEPTEGYAELHGRVGSLLEVGTGFHPELTGRENVYLNGAILGMRRSEIDRKFDEMVAFAEIERFIDTVVKHYSTGMYLRLAFAVAAHLEPEILLVDEVLAVGDARFQRKCMAKMSDVAREGKTVLFISHNMPAVLNICQRAIVLADGKVVCDAPARDAVEKYNELIGDMAGVPLGKRRDRKGNQRLTFQGYELRDAEGAPVEHATSGHRIDIVLIYQSAGPKRLHDVHVAIGIRGQLDEHLFHLSTSTVGPDFQELPPDGKICCTLPRLPLQPGRYTFAVFCSVGGEIADWIQAAGHIDVEAGDFFRSGLLPPCNQGPFLVDQSWRGLD